MNETNLKLNGVGANFSNLVNDSVEKRGTQRLNDSEVLLTPDESNTELPNNPEIMLVGKNNLTPHIKINEPDLKSKKIFLDTTKVAQTTKL